MKRTRLLLALPACALLAAGLSCSKVSVILPKRAGTVALSVFSGKKDAPVPGIDLAQVYYGKFGDGLAFVLGSDFKGARFSGNANSSLKGATYTIGITTKGGTDISVAGRTGDGKTGTVKIIDTEYALEKGSFFLLKMADGKLEVVQLKRDTLGIKDEEVHFKKLATEDEDIKKFYSK